jgi:hypothetical protein
MPSIVSESAGVEAATGLVLLIAPQLFASLLLGTGLGQAEVVVARVCGFALLSLGLACWPEKQVPVGEGGTAVARGLLTYNASIAAYLAYLRILGGYRGILLVPAILLHVVITTLLVKHYAGRAPRARESGPTETRK